MASSTGTHPRPKGWFTVTQITDLLFRYKLIRKSSLYRGRRTRARPRPKQAVSCPCSAVMFQRVIAPIKKRRAARTAGMSSPPSRSRSAPPGGGQPQGLPDRGYLPAGPLPGRRRPRVGAAIPCRPRPVPGDRHSGDLPRPVTRTYSLSDKARMPSSAALTAAFTAPLLRPGTALTLQARADLSE
jgi:hypothetical protein